uniref:Olfactory receptor n=1 Tax=Pyxicephalus adspersus TaxID=30357 RepID=A0AAV2ZT05_PYXAD|nr:TPA: hypothetical protein GDO54_004389 [Pyxicephalus adspersus]
MVNETQIYFTLLGFQGGNQFRDVVCFITIFIYSSCLMGNLAIVTVIIKDSHLQTPMYSFLCNLSILDSMFPSVTLPKFIKITLIKSGITGISFMACMLQATFVVTFQSTEVVLLTVMSYDRYVAICLPLHYQHIMNRRLCILLAVFSWTVCYFFSLPIVLQISLLSFCGSGEINHFYCDIIPLLQLSCSNIIRVQVAIYTAATILGFPCFLLTLISYVFIVSAILMISSTEGRQKAFSTCSSHLTVVILLYSVIFAVYLENPSHVSLSSSKVLSILNVALIPTLNPVIYSFRNNLIMRAFQKMLTGKI